MSGPVPRTVADLDVSVETLRAAFETSHSPSDRIAYRLDVALLEHLERVSTEADYPGWTPGGVA